MTKDGENIARLIAQMEAVQRRLDKTEEWINRAIMALLGGGLGAVYAYASTLGIF